MTAPDFSAPDFTAIAVHFCADVPRTARFYESLGLTRRLSTPHDTFVTLVAGDGLLMLHAARGAQTGARPGLAELALEVTDLDTTAAWLTDLGLEPVRWDESYGQHLGIRDPHGDGIWINERQRDLHGYRAHEAAPNDVNLLAVRYSTDFATDAAFFAQLGFSARPSASEHFTPLEGQSPSRGVIGLHPPAGYVTSGPFAPDNPIAPPVVVDISLETHEPLTDLQARLDASGIANEFVDGPAPHVVVTDPEGAELEIHIAP